VEPLNSPVDGQPLKARPTIIAQTPVSRGKYDYVISRVRTHTGREFERGCVRHPGAVVVVAITDDRKLVLIRNWRMSLQKVLIECCAGTIERSRTADGSWDMSEAGGEKPEVCAARELEEETGYRAGHLAPLGSFYTTPGMTDELMYAFFATQLTHVGQRLEPDEHIEVQLATVDETLAMIADGRLCDAKSMLAVLVARQKGSI